MRGDAHALAVTRQLAELAGEEAEDAFGTAAYLIAAALHVLAPVVGAHGALDAISTLIENERHRGCQ